MKEQNPLISIVIPVYNGSNYLREAIDSALAQTYSNVEIIVVNDGSNDNGKTEEIALSYGDKIKYFAKENGGVATALNFGISQMQGKYFSWLSHDDVYYPEKIQSQIEYLNKQKDESLIVYSTFDIIDKSSKLVHQVILNHNALMQKPLYGLLRTQIHGCSLLIPKEAFQKYGIFDATLRFTQDYDLWFRFSKYYRFVHMDKSLIQSRAHDEQDSKKHYQSPTEGNTFWCKQLEGFEDREILSCEKSKVWFFVKMAIYFKGTPYREAYKCSKKLAYENALFQSFFLLYIFLVGFYLKKIARFILKKIKFTLSNRVVSKKGGK